MLKRVVLPTLLLTLAAILAACGTQATPTPTPTSPPTPTPTPQAPAELGGGVLAVFNVLGKEFKLWTTNPTAIDELERWRDGEREGGIPNGALREGPGPANYNAPWSWHLDPEDIDIADVTIELCDGTPDMVEDDLDYWLNTVQRYCTWEAELVELVDYR